ncbi:hypothetical protein JQ557_01050 [Bradyrhizobium sp. U87765 SZCCT0131]|uniref:hypothetical protein n=1 Tax=unclassified Bradyrhizobium TaxID=2631580 RepID=UPI001BABFA82|nr:MULTISPECIES: hypothetical protein [unclassified Bradyrhizobium]MBR1216560.1 hypothetical protein [Bradyrhizobium sp. U87765 SZCCT0131]MBR1259684.1 hypothetical protein [Bradyrhizobium sp. U87765 SZCCT0134]MBR1305825.1 hypothetical protein [Bradyrhizobium sp. U87765 SZCCT0110]MBR1322192.1 hypothetical protein [Bradyrhizobium sp. U87765 SZCCT0109]MBR1350529.1 hypothetical protein [Bradyrhizobium sp. U87765 SZCCT0048]
MTQALLIYVPASTPSRRTGQRSPWRRMVRAMRDLVMGPIDRLARAADVGQVLEARAAGRPGRATFTLRSLSPCAAFKHLKHLT